MSFRFAGLLSCRFLFACIMLPVFVLTSVSAQQWVSSHGVNSPYQPPQYLSGYGFSDLPGATERRQAAQNDALAAISRGGVALPLSGGAALRCRAPHCHGAYHRVAPAGCDTPADIQPVVRGVSHPRRCGGAYSGAGAGTGTRWWQWWPGGSYPGEGRASVYHHSGTEQIIEVSKASKPTIKIRTRSAYLGKRCPYGTNKGEWS
jgi:hypothetical protein